MSKRSSNNNNSGGLSSSSNKHENGWPCLVYRLQSHRGWEVYTDEDLQSATTTSNNKKNKSNKEEYLLRVEPTEGSIEVKQMRIRIPLKQDEDKRLNTNYEDGGGWNNNPLIVRRRNSLLVSVRRGYGAIMFYFKSVTDCKEFCDKLVLLNRDLLTPAKSNNIGEDASSSSSANDGRYINGMNRRELHIDEMIGNKRNRSLAFGDNNIATQKLLPTNRFEYDSVEDKPAKVGEIQQCQRQEEMMSYITKLAHSEEFRGFVHELERGLDSSVMP